MADRSIVYRLQADVAGFRSQMAQASASTKKLATDLTSMEASAVKNRQALEHFGGMAGRVGLVAAAGLGASVKAAMDWETAWTGVLKTVDGTPAQLAALERGLRDLATETGFAHAEVAAVAEAAGQLGISTGGIEAFTSTMLDMGVSTSLSSEEAATGLARLRNIMGSTEAEIANTGAAMVELGNNFATTEGEILAMSQRIAGAGRQAGLSTADVLGLSAAMSSVGIEAEAGGTAISLTMKRIGKEVETGGDSLDLFARTSGMTVAEFTQAWGQDAAGTLTKFVAGLGQAEAMGMSTNEVLRELGVTGIREADALLRLSGNAEGLADAFATANDGFRENTALTEEAGKFYATSAQQVKQSWAEIKDAAIDVGAVMLPVVEGVATAVGGIASAFKALPGPVKGATGALMGVTAVLGSGAWFGTKVISGIADTRAAMDTLNLTMPKTAGRLGKVGKAAGIAGAALGAFAIVVAATERESGAAGVEKITQALLDLSDGAAGAAGGIDALFTRQASALGGPLTMQSEIDGLSDAFAALETHWAKKIWSDPIFIDSDWDLAADSFARIDAEMASLVQSGNVDQAAANFDYFMEAAEKAGWSTEEAAALLPEYADALVGVENESRGAAGGIDQLAGAMTEAEAATQNFESTLENLNAQLSGRAALRDYEAALDDFTDAVRENGRAWDINTAKGRNNQEALDNIAESALRVAEGMGVADRQKFLTESIKDLQQMGREMGVPQSEIKALIELLRQANDASVDPNIDADTGSAQAKIRALQEQIAAMTDRKIIYVDTIHRTLQGGQIGMHATGGYIAGPGTATSDSIPAYLSNGEYVVKAAAVQKYGVHMFHELNAMRFADGGAVGASGRAVGVGSLSLERTLKQLQRAIERDTEKRDELRRERDSARSAAMSSFDGDIFGNGLAGMRLQLEADRNDANAMRKALKQAQGKGLDGALFQALAASGDLNTAQQMAGLSRREIREYEQLYAQRATAQNRLGATAAAPYQKEIRDLNKEIRALRNEVKSMGKNVRDGARAGISDRTKAQNQRAKAGARG